MRSRSSEIARARPLLGTLVEIRARNTPRAPAAIAAAFNVVAEVHRLMSAHEADSDIGRLNRFAHVRVVRVHAYTWIVLRLARRISEASGGAFDICVAPQLARWGYLPPWVGRQCAGLAGWDAVELLPRRRIRFRRRIAIDLGGIAKGYAVDRAAAVLCAHGIRCFTVNAGGDLRVGDEPELVHVRDPAAPTRLLPIARARNAAVATSGSYFAWRRRGGRRVHPITIPGTCRCPELPGSITVLAQECAVADALTKTVAVQGPASAKVLAHFRAQACIVEPGGAVTRYA